MKQFNKNSGKSDAGFTLIELIVSLGITAVIIVIVLGAYINLMRIRQKTINQVEVAQDGQNIINEMIKNIKKGKLAYSVYQDLGGLPETGVTSTLILQDLGETPTSTITYIYYRKCAVSESRTVVQRCHPVDGSLCNLSENCFAENDFKTLTMADLTVKRLDFHINPKIDPYLEGTTAIAHPRVTVVMNFCSIKQKPKPTPLIIQRTVSQKWEEKK